MRIFKSYILDRVYVVIQLQFYSDTERVIWMRSSNSELVYNYE